MTASGFDLLRQNGQPTTWSAGTVAMKVQLGSTASLSDGSSANSSVQLAMEYWNAVLGVVQFTSTVGSPAAPVNQNGVNEIGFDSKVYGTAFDANVLAVTVSYYSTTPRSDGTYPRTQSDIIFNQTYAWDSYRGGLRVAEEIQRVALHELGHVLGLSHPDEATPRQSVPALMNSQISDLDALTADDIAGGQYLYGVPTPVPATIRTQPVGQTVARGSSATFTVGVGGTGPHRYQWRKNGSDLTASSRYTGIDRATLVIAGVQDADAGAYSVVVSNSFGSATSADATLIVAGPRITVSPLSRLLVVGQPATLTVAATSSSPLTYTWKHNGAVVPGATEASLNLASVTMADSGFYEVVVTDSVGAARTFFRVRAVAGNLALVGWGDNAYGQSNTPSSVGAVAAVDGGAGHTLVLKADGSVQAWGRPGEETAVPTNLAPSVAISANGNTSMALSATGLVTVWGVNTKGQIAVPAGLGSVVDIAAGGEHCLALKADGTVVAWGDNSWGQVSVPEDLRDVVAIDAGGYHSLALRADGTVVMWGNNFNYSPGVPPSGLSGVIAIAAGNFHSLALKSDGTVVAWGFNYNGQATVPSGLSGVIAIAAGTSHSMALRANGELVFWGHNASGQSTLPVGLSSIAAIAGGDNHSLALVPSAAPAITLQPVSRTINVGTTAQFSVSASGIGTLSYQWRRNGVNMVDGAGIAGATAEVLQIDAAGFGAIGTYDVVVTSAGGSVVSSGAVLTIVTPPGIGGSSASQTVVQGQPIFLQVEATGSGLTYGWKHNGFTIPGAIGPTINRSSATLADAGFYEVVITNPAGGVSRAYFTLRVALPGQTVVAWGANYYGQSTVPAGLFGVLAVAAGNAHSLALLPDGTVRSWGSNEYGQQAAPIGLSDVIAIAAGGAFSLALKSDGTVSAWGNNLVHQTEVPEGLSQVIAISAGGSHSLALKSDGTVVSWGNGAPAAPAGLSDIVAVSAGLDHSLVLKSDGSVFAWGYDPFQAAIPVGLDHVVAIAAGSSFNLALKSDGSVVVWKSIGGFVWSTSAKSITDLPAELTDVTAIAGGYGRALVAKSDGSLVSWGHNSNGQASLPLGLKNVSALSLGGAHSLALVTPVVPSIVVHPASTTVVAGSSVELRVTGAGSGPISYRWHKNGTPLVNGLSVQGTDTASLTITGAATTDTGAYSVVLSNFVGTAASNSANLTVTPAIGAPVIVRSPVSQTAGQSASVTLFVLAQGTAPLSYQWYEGREGDRSRPVSGGQQVNLAVPASSAAFYWVRVSNSQGFADSKASLVLPCAARNPGLSPANLISVSYANGRYFAMSYEQGASSIDGISWSPFRSTFFGKVVYGRGSYVAGRGSTTSSVYRSSDGASWGSMTSGLSSSVVSGLSFARDAFVAVGNGGVTTSSDGTTWQFQSNPSLNDVAFGNGRFVAVGPEGLILVSFDGKTWLNVASPTAQQFHAIAFGQGCFVAFASTNENQILVSTDGFNWTPRPLPTLPMGGQIMPGIGSMAYGSGVFALSIGRHLLLSLDAIDWTVTMNFLPVSSSYLHSLAYGGGTFMVAGEDGSLFQSLAIPGSVAITAQSSNAVVLPGQTVVLAVSTTGSNLTYQWYAGESGDTSRPIPGANGAAFTTPPATVTTKYWLRISDGGDVVDGSPVTVTVASLPMVSVNSLTEEAESGATVSLTVTASGVPAPTLQWYEGKAGDVTRPVAGGTGNTITVTAGQAVARFWVRATNVAGTTDSSTVRVIPWVRRALSNSSSPTLDGVAYGAGRYAVMGGSIGDFYSADGQAWQRVPGFVAVGGQSGGPIAYGRGGFVTTDLDTSGAIWTSPDGLTWTKRVIPGSSAVYQSVAAAGDYLFALAGSGTFAVATDGVTWTQQSTGAGLDFADVAYGNGRYVAVGNGIAISTNGLAWTKLSYAVPGSLFRVAYGNGLFVAVGAGNSGIILTSPDGQNWTSRVSPVQGNGVYDVCYSGGRYVIASADGLVTSSDGVTWRIAVPFIRVLSLAVGDRCIFGVGFSAPMWQSAPLDEEAPPAFVLSPASQSIVGGKPATFSASASGFPAPLYQWRKNGVPLAGATSTTFSLSSATFADAGVYDVTATNEWGAATSNLAVVTVVPAPVTAPADFNGDDKPDLVWSNSITGERALWLMNGTNFLAASTLGVFPLEWTIAGTGDFNGDGKPDIIWSNSVTGERALWLMNGTSLLGVSTLGIFPAEWTVAGTADFNADGRPDIIWSNSVTGERAIWLMNGTNFLAASTLGIFPLEWTVAATGDFNRDRQPDIVWSNSVTGERAIWLMNGTNFLAASTLGIFPLEWTVVGTADFNADRKPDIIWSNSVTGERALWLMDGTNFLAASTLGIFPLEWTVKN